VNIRRETRKTGIVADGAPAEEHAVSETHLEIERKFDVGADFVLPDLNGVPRVARVEAPQERQLEAIYHDTADLRLARAKVTLRRRTGGPDAGWHVKLPAAAAARRELHSPLGRAGRTVPKAVQSPVQGIVRTAPLGPVATLQTRRVVTLLRDDDDRVLAEVADDTVTGTALPATPGEPATVQAWREVEVELVDGDDELLAAVAQRLLDAGARPSPAPSKLAKVLADRLAAVDGAPAATPSEPEKATAGEVVVAAVAAQAAALQDADLMVRTGGPDGVHQVRVACRRLRSILAAFRPVLAREHTDELREELRWLGSQLSGARDAEVGLEHLRELVAAQPVELVLGPVAARLEQAEIEDHEQGTKAARKTLGSARYLALRDQLDALVVAPPLAAEAGRPAPAVLRAVLAKTIRRLRRDVHVARDAADSDQRDHDDRDHDERDHALHEVRKAGKRVRYTAEVAAPFLGDRTAALIETMKDLQDLLGERQDTVVTRQLCRQQGLAAHAAGENAWTYGRLEALEQSRAERAERDFWAWWPDLRTELKQVTRR
jgi:CHAD domain-containing protein